MWLNKKQQTKMTTELPSPLRTDEEQSTDRRNTTEIKKNAGFQKGRFCSEQIFTLGNII